MNALLKMLIGLVKFNPKLLPFVLRQVADYLEAHPEAVDELVQLIPDVK